MTIAILGEGAADVGQRNYGEPGFQEGAVPLLIRRFLPGVGVEFRLVEKQDRKKDDKKLGRHARAFQGRHRQEGWDGHSNIASWLKGKAAELGADVAVYYCDADREAAEDSRHEHVCRKRYHDIKRGMELGFAQAKGRAAGIGVVPVKMLESWLLSDEGAFVRAFPGGRKGKKGQGRGKGRTENLPPRPELAWGAKEDGESNYPKNQLRRILEGYGQGSNRESYRALAAKLDLGVARQRCPISFPDFCEDCQRLARERE